MEAIWPPRPSSMTAKTKATPRRAEGMMAGRRIFVICNKVLCFFEMLTER